MTNAQLTLSKTKDKVITTYKKAEEKLGLLFIVIVIIPTICSIIYFGFWASDVYISRSQFVIRTAQNPTNPAISDYTIASSLTASAVLQDSAAIVGYMQSMDALRSVNEHIDLTKLFTSHDIDIFNRFASIRSAIRSSAISIVM
jgi:capsular polysaccharide transport system permease protein